MIIFAVLTINAAGTLYPFQTTITKAMSSNALTVNANDKIEVLNIFKRT